MLRLSALVLDLSSTVAMPCVLFSSKLIYFTYCFMWLNPLCRKLGQPRWEKCLVIRLELRQGYLLLVHL